MFALFVSRNLSIFSQFCKFYDRLCMLLSIIKVPLNESFHFCRNIWIVYLETRSHIFANNCRFNITVISGGRE